MTNRHRDPNMLAQVLPVPLSRRELLKRGAIALGAAALPVSGGVGSAMAQQANTKDQPQTATLKPNTPAGAIDAHVHVWTPDVKRYPLAADFTPEQMQPRSFTPERLLAHAQPCGVDRIV